ncbi:alpha/beta hydrolase fold domain-containing protein [bacterium]|nr:alpha/beta hydrolase fold domain-containing protein [bacterium]
MFSLHQWAFSVVVIVAEVAIAGSPAAGQNREFVRETAAYKTVGDLAIHADVYRPPGEQVVPVIVWIHGGALINGHREAVSGQIRHYAQSRGFALVSIDYRLAPETKLPAILDDIKDAFVWIRGRGARQFHLDPQRIVVTGGSAGGYLTLTTGYLVKPPPQALVAFWGYGDLIGPWFSSPSPHERHNRVKPSRDEAWQQVSGPPIADSRERKGDGALFYYYCRQTGLWPKNVSNWDPHTEPQKFFPFMPVKNVTANWPPTLMIHGTADTDVPYEQSVLMVREFQQHKARHRLISIKNGEHGLSGGDSGEIEAAYLEAGKFLDEFLLEPAGN